MEGVTAEGDTALHVVAACGQGDDFFTRRWCWCLTRSKRHALTTYGDGDNFLQSACIIYEKAKHLLFVQNNNGDTGLHCAAWAGESKMVACLIDLALAEGGDRTKELLRKENKQRRQPLPPETSNLSSVFIFTECILSGTRQTSYLPSAALKTLGKEEVCQVSKKNTQQREGLLSVFFFALGKEIKSFFWERRRRKK